MLAGEIEFYHFEKRFIHKNGDIIWTILSAGCVRKPDRYVDYMVAILQNISERKQAEESLRESEARYQDLYENAPDMYLSVDPHTRKIVHCNQTTAMMTGFEKHEIIGLPVIEMYHPDCRDKARQAFHSFICNGEVNDSELQVCRKDGSILDISLNVSAVKDNKGNIIMSRSSWRDITKRKLAEEALRNSEAGLKESNAAKDRLFSIIAHDLKSPFNSILGLSGILAERSREQNNKDFEKISAMVHLSTLNAFELLTNLLEWSGVQTGRIEFAPEHIEMAQAIENVIKLSDEPARQKSITISKDAPKNLIIYADKSMIETVLRNLVANAIKYSDTGGTIGVSVEQNRDELVVSVRDNGAGIPKDAMKKLFNLGETFSTKGTKNEKGTGLGLLLCKEFVEKYGGKIWAESEYGKGSTFSFSIPL